MLKHLQKSFECLFMVQQHARQLVCPKLTIHNSSIRELPRAGTSANEGYNEPSKDSNHMDTKSRRAFKNLSTSSKKPSNKHKTNSSYLTISNLSNNRTSKFKGVRFEGNRKGNFIFGGKSDLMADKMANEDPEALVQYEQDLDLYARSEHLYHSKTIQEDIRMRRKIKLGIIKKKMNKLEGVKNQNINLLTWDAKEQIKYLNLNYPDEWTVEKIVESFPITEESCNKLLKSKWAPKTLDDLIAHDERAIKSWDILSEKENYEYEAPAINIYEEYKKTNRLSLIKNANGIADLEFKRSQILPDSYSIHQQVLTKPGKFSKLIQPNDKIKLMFNKKTNEDAVAYEKSKQNTNDALFTQHLNTTNINLSNILAKLFAEAKEDKRPTRNQIKPKN